MDKTTANKPPVTAALRHPQKPCAGQGASADMQHIPERGKAILAGLLVFAGLAGLATTNKDFMFLIMIAPSIAIVFAYWRLERMVAGHQNRLREKVDAVFSEQPT